MAWQNGVERDRMGPGIEAMLSMDIPAGSGESAQKAKVPITEGRTSLNKLPKVPITSLFGRSATSTSARSRSGHRRATDEAHAAAQAQHKVTHASQQAAAAILDSLDSQNPAFNYLHVSPGNLSLQHSFSQQRSLMGTSNVGHEGDTLGVTRSLQSLSTAHSVVSTAGPRTVSRADQGLGSNGERSTLSLPGQAASRTGVSAPGAGDTRLTALLKAPKIRTGSAVRKDKVPITAGPSHAHVPQADVLAKDKINRDVLQRIQEVFKHADADGTGNLSAEEFVTSFKGVLQTDEGSSEDALAKVFMRIDANCDGRVDWHEFSSYMLLESQGTASIRDLENSISFEAPETFHVREEYMHSKSITHIEHVTLPSGADRYVTCAKDGLVKIWNAKDKKHMRTINTGKGWVTCAKKLPLTHKLAVASFSRSMKIYDLQPPYDLVGQIPEVDYAPMSMDVWVPSRRRDVEMIVFGDGGGFVRMFELHVNPLEDKTSHDKYLHINKWAFQHHTDWVTCVKYIEELSAVVAGSLDKHISITDAEERVPVKLLEGHKKGVSALDWSPLYKFIVTGAQDRRLMLWNPFSQKPLATLTGHLANVTTVIVNDKDNQIISVSADKQVKLWDVRNHRCIQTIVDPDDTSCPDEDALGCGTYDKRRKQLVTGHLVPTIWRQTITAVASSGHRTAVTRVLYNPLFHEAVTGDQSGSISVWHVTTGKLRFRFINTHKDQQVTCIAFDANKRRLLTGTESGEVKVWNFSSGACLCQLHTKSKEEVTALASIRGPVFKHFLVAGWDRRITYFEDAGPSQKESWPGRVVVGHKADILDMVVMEGGNVMVTASDDGEVCTWNVESGALRKRMSPEGHSLLPMNEQSIESIRFLHGKLHHVCATVGADRYLRLWDCIMGVMLAEQFTGHMIGETVVGLAVHPSNDYIATGDSKGYIKVWDLSTFIGEVTTAAVMVEVSLWRAHKLSITSLDWVHNPKTAVPGFNSFLLSSSVDRTASMWSEQGAFVGQFGAHVWVLNEPSTWRCEEPYPLDAKDRFDMSVSQQVPGRQRSFSIPPQDSPRNLSFRNPGSLSPNRAGHKGGPCLPLAMESCATRGSGQVPGLLNDMNSPRSQLTNRPTTAPEGVAQVLMASTADRLRRVHTMRREERPQDFEDGGKFSRQASRSQGCSRPGSPGEELVPLPGLDPYQAMGSFKFGGQDSVHDDMQDEELPPESSSSSGHSSDNDVPLGLWMDEFELARRKAVRPAPDLRQPRSQSPSKTTGARVSLPSLTARKGLKDSNHTPSRR